MKIDVFILNILKQISSDTTKVDSSIIVILKEAQKDTLIKLKSEKN